MSKLTLIIFTKGNKSQVLCSMYVQARIRADKVQGGYFCWSLSSCKKSKEQGIATCVLQSGNWKNNPSISKAKEEAICCSPQHEEMDSIAQTPVWIVSLFEVSTYLVAKKERQTPHLELRI